MTATPEPAAIRATFAWLNHSPHGVTELRVVKTGGGVEGIGFFTNPAAFVRACLTANARGNVYAGIQPRPLRFLDDTPNILLPRASGARSDDVTVVSATVIDLDPVRPRDTASTDAERDGALAVADAAASWLETQGFVRPQVMMSGNGAQLWLAFDPIELDPSNRATVSANLKAFESGVRERFATPEIKVDSIHDLGRIIKVIGTVGRKGGDTAERPHRVSYPVGDHDRRPCAALRALLLTPQVVAPAAMPSAPKRHLPLATVTPVSADTAPVAPGASPAPLTSVAPVSLCGPMQQLWDVGYPPDRSDALFAVTRLLAHKGLALDDIVPLVTDFDRRTGAKLADRNAAAFIRRDYKKITEAAAGGAIQPPCGMVQTKMGYCPVHTDPRAVCELHDPVIDIPAAIEALPAQRTSAGDYRLRRIFDAVADDGTDPAAHFERIAARLGLAEVDMVRALESARVRVSQRRLEQARPGAQAAAPSTAPGSLPPSAATGVAAAPLAALDGTIVEDGSTYCVPTRDGRRVISSFVLTPTRRITTERGEIIVADGRTDFGTSFAGILLPRAAFNSRHELLKNLPSPDMQWTGDDKHVQGLLRRLAGHPGVPRQHGTTVLGAHTHEGIRLWVFPGGALSEAGFLDPPPMVYVPSGNSLDQGVRYERTDDATFAAIARVVFTELPRVNLPDVVVPLIGWFFATPLKPGVMRRRKAFPVANVTGTAGTGKTSLATEIFLPLAGLPDAEPGSVTSTEFPLLRQLSATNAVPVVLDEYKPQDMPQVKVDQIHRYVRRIYKGEAEERGHANQSVTTYHLTAPLAILGETRPSDAALLERFITASPTKGTLERHPACKAAFARLRAMPLHLFAPRYIQFTLARDLDADLAVADARTAIAVGDRPLPVRVVANLRVMALGVYLFEQFAAACGEPLEAPLDLAEGVEAVIRDVTGGEGQVRNALDHFVETLAVMASQRELREGVDYAFRDGVLFVRLEVAYQRYRRHLRDGGYRENAVDIDALRRFIRENFTQGGYIAEDPTRDNRTYFPAGGRYRAIAIDVARAAHLLGGEFQGGSPSVDAWPWLEER